MTMEEKTHLSFQMILHAGNARNLALEAMEKARVKDFYGAKTKMDEANGEYKIAHELQTGILVDFTNNPEMIADVLLTHAQDHLISAATSIDLATEILILREELENERNK